PHHFQSRRFANSVLSSNYELLFSQLLSFHNHLRCPLFFAFTPAFLVSPLFVALPYVSVLSLLSTVFAHSDPGGRGRLIFCEAPFTSHTPPVAASYRGCHNSSLHAFLGVTHGCPH